MKHLFFLMSLIFIVSFQGLSQELKPDRRPQMQVEDPYPQYQAFEVNNLDLIQALDFAGIGIHKFDIGTFSKKYKIQIYIKEYKNDELIKTDTVLQADNEYYYYKRGHENSFVDYIDQIKVFTKEESQKLILRFHTYNRVFTEELFFDRLRENQYFRIRKYINTNWELDKEIPLMVYASSWFDKDIGSERFCGVVNLSKNDDMTGELLSSTPHYFEVSYKVFEYLDK